MVTTSPQLSMKSLQRAKSSIRFRVTNNLTSYILGIASGLFLYHLVSLFISTRPKHDVSANQKSLDCLKVMRLGVGYHAWSFCSPVKETFDNKIVYSIGVGADITWDKAMIDRLHTEQYGWDPTMPPVRYFKKYPMPPHFHFNRYGLGLSDGNVKLLQRADSNGSLFFTSKETKFVNGTVDKYPSLTLGSMMAKLGHEWLSILKIDIEGLEFDIIDGWAQSLYLIPADQILIEFHERLFSRKAKSRQSVQSAVDKLSKLGYQLICHTAWEYSFARRAAILRKPTKVKYIRMSAT